MPSLRVGCQQSKVRGHFKSCSVPALPLPNSRKRSRQQFCQTLSTQTLQYIIATQTVRRCYFHQSIFPPILYQQSPPKRQRLSQNLNDNHNHNHNHNHDDNNQV